MENKNSEAVNAMGQIICNSFWARPDGCSICKTCYYYKSIEPDTKKHEKLGTFKISKIAVYSLAYNCENVVYMDCFGRRFFDIEVENLKYSGNNVCIGLFSEVLTFQTGHSLSCTFSSGGFFMSNSYTRISFETKSLNELFFFFSRYSGKPHEDDGARLDSKFARSPQQYWGFWLWTKV